MAVAVILPLYGGDQPEHVEQALTSIGSQRDVDESIRIYLGIDGPLPEELEDVVNNFQRELYHVVRHAEHVGPTRNMNTLLDALGDERLIFRMDADDIAAPNRFAQQIRFLDTHPDIAIVGSAIEEFDEVSGWSQLRTYPTDPETIAREICIACPLAHPAVCMRPCVIQAVGFYPEMRGQDIAMWFEATRLGFRISNLTEPLLKLRTSPAFFERRSWLGRAWPEFLIYMRGIWRLHGITWRYIYPVSRFALRLCGPRLSRVFYTTNLRNKIAGHRSPE